MIFSEEDEQVEEIIITLQVQGDPRKKEQLQGLDETEEEGTDQYEHWRVW